MLPALLL
jgi:hypothetical protein